MEEKSIIKLNVGGHFFCTTRTTLLRVKGSFFESYLSDRFAATMDSEGRLFIDRDGVRFRHILNFLRNNTLLLSNRSLLQEILEEAHYYGLDSLVAMIDLRLDKQSRQRAEICRSLPTDHGVASNKTPINFFDLVDFSLTEDF